MSIDLDALVRLLGENPEQRAALRRVILGDEPDVTGVLGSIAGSVHELAEAQGRTEERVAGLAEAQGRTEERVAGLAEAQGRTEERLAALTARVDALTGRVDALTKDVRALAVAQRATEDSLKALVDTVRGMNDRLAKLDGDALERRYRERGHAYFARIARRLRSVGNDVLSPLVDDGEEDGRLTASEANSVLLADAVFTGRTRDDGTLVHLVVEASVSIARHDVRRARERADLLGRLVDTPVLAAVAGEFAPEPVMIAAQDAEVWTVTNGRVIAPTDDLDAFLA